MTQRLPPPDALPALQFDPRATLLARLPPRVVRYQKPLSADRLCGYLDALTVRLLGQESVNA